MSLRNPYLECYELVRKDFRPNINQTCLHDNLDGSESAA